MAKRHWRDWNYKGVAKLTTEDGSENVTRGVRERDGTDSNGQAAIELKEVALEAEHPKITLQQAARDGRENVIKQWIGLLPADSIDDLDSEGFTALHYATRFNKFKIIQLLIASGADPELESGEEKLTPLHFAASFKPSRDDEATDAASPGAQHGLAIRRQAQITSKNIIEFLVTSCGVKVNRQDRYGVTPLHLACSEMNIAAVEVLLQCTSIDPSIKDNNHNTPLHEACQSGNKVIVEKILQWMKVGVNTLDLSSLNREKRSPLHVAAKNGHSSIVKLILHHSFDCRAKLVDATDTEGSTPLHLACESRDEETVRTLLVSGADIKARKYDEVSALHSAAAHDAVGIAQILLEAGLDIQSIDAHHQSPLHYATRHNRVEMVKFLIERGADIEAVDAEFYTPLLVAALHGQMEVFLVLLQKEASIDVMEKDGKNVIFLAAENNHVALLRKVLEHPLGAGLCDERDLVHNTPLHVAAAKGNHKVVDALLHATVQIKARNRFGQTATQVAAENGQEKVLKKLIAHCRDVVFDEDEKGYTPLHFACRSGHFAAAKVLVVEGEASIEAKNFKLWTPLTYAAKVGSEPLTEMLIKAGADIDPKDRFKQTPLHLACRGGHTRVVTLLTSHGADVTEKDQNGFNALDAAIDEGHEEVAMAIVKGHKWAAAMRNVTQSRLGGETTPLRKLIRKMPAVAEEVFNRCTVPNTSKTVSPDSPEYRVVFNYEFIEDLRDKPSRTQALRKTIRRRQKVTVPGTQVASDSEAIGGKRHGYTTDWGPEGFKTENHPLTIMVESERTELLKHPLVTSLLDYKWRKYTRYVYFGNVAVYFLYIAFLTAFALVVHSPLEIPCQMALYDSSRNGSEVDCELSAHRSRFLFISAIIIILFAVLRLIIESLQLFQYRLAYLFSWVNWLENMLFVCSIIFAFVFLNECLCPYTWQWQIGAIAVFLAWIDLVIFLQKFPLTGIYILMFVDIFYTFCRMIVLSTLLVIAFGLAFYMCFYDPSMSNVSFTNPGFAILRTMTMTTGEFDYVPLFRQDGETNGIAFPPVSYILWIIFIILMPILLTNLLVGLAVDDIKGILEAAVLKRKALQVELALSVEQRFPRRIRRFFITGMLEVAPNRNLSLWEQFAYQVWGGERFDSPENIAGAVKFIPPVDSIEHHTRSLVSDMRNLKQTVSEIAERNNHMEKLIRKIAKRNGINVSNK